QARRAQLAEQPLVGRALGQHPVAASVSERQDRLAAEAGARLADALGDQRERVVPGDARECRLTLPAGAPHRMQQAIGAVQALAEAAHLVADEAGRDRVRPVAFDRDDPPVLDRDVEAAAIRAIERAHGAYRRHGIIVWEWHAPR